MCGIDVLLQWGQVRPAVAGSGPKPINKLIASRGPDHHGSHTLQPTPCTTLTLTSSVLNLRADTVCQQPYVLAGGSVLCYNGEIYRMRGEEVARGTNSHYSDTQLLAQQLETLSTDNVCQRLQQLLESCEGPWSLVYYHAATHTLCWARDSMGRRSLMLEVGSDNLRITSVRSSGSAQSDEIVPCGIYSLCLDALSDSSSDAVDIKQHIQCRLFTHVTEALQCGPTVVLPSLNRPYRDILPYRRTSLPPFTTDAAADSDAEDEQDAMPVKATGAQRTTRKDRQAQHALEQQSYVPRAVNMPLLTTFSQLLHEAVRIRVQTICNSNSTRQLGQPVAESSLSTVGLLFSGGLDCTVLAYLVHHYLPVDEPIDLLAVAFAGDLTPTAVRRVVPDRITAIQSYNELKSLAPERDWRLIEINVTLEQMQEQRQHVQQLIQPHSTVMDFNIGSMLWFAAKGQGQVLEDDVAMQSASANTTLTATDFRSTASPSPPIQITYRSRARVLFSGLGADEQLGGYGRHRTRWRHAKADAARSLPASIDNLDVSINQAADLALSAELDRDVGRLWRRNLGRDDRCIADSGREVRHPYLDERLMQFVSSVPISDICDYNMPSGGDLHQPAANKQHANGSATATLPGDKQLLRQLAFQLGLKQTATLAKRALQFGSRISNRRVAGTNNFDDSIVLQDVVHPQLVAPWRKSVQPAS